MKTNILLDVCEDSFQRIGGVGDVEFRMMKVDEEVWKIPLHTVVGTPKSAMGVVPSPCAFISGAFLEERSPFVVPEFQPQRELCFTDSGKVPQK